MIVNTGKADRAARLALGLALLGSPLAWYGPENINAWGYIGLLPFFSGLTGFCAVYALLGWSTAHR